jgi:hypothetical protein
VTEGVPSNNNIDNYKHEDEINDIMVDQFDPEDEINPDEVNFNPRHNYFLKDFFGLLSDDDELQEMIEREDWYKYFIGIEIYPDHESIIEPSEEELKIYRNMERQIYYSIINVLLVYVYPYYQAFRIGENIGECQFIGLSLYSNDIWDIINYHLATGECDLHW